MREATPLTRSVVCSRSPIRPAMAEDLAESLFTCSCCYDLLVEPTTLMCGHSFCRICLARWYLESGKRECPECRQVYLGVPKVNIVLRVGPELKQQVYNCGQAGWKPSKFNTF